MRTAAYIIGGIASVMLIMLCFVLFLRGMLDVVDGMFPDPSPLITKADYRQCVTVIGPPLKPQKRFSGQSPNIHPEIV